MRKNWLDKGREEKPSLYVCTNICIYISVCIYGWAIGLMSRVFTNGRGDWGSIPGRVIPKSLKMVLDATLLNAQHFKVRMKG